MQAETKQTWTTTRSPYSLNHLGWQFTNSYVTQKGLQLNSCTIKWSSFIAIDWIIPLWLSKQPKTQPLKDKKKALYGSSAVLLESFNIKGYIHRKNGYISVMLYPMKPPESYKKVQSSSTTQTKWNNACCVLQKPVIMTFIFILYMFLKSSDLNNFSTLC